MFYEATELPCMGRYRLFIPAKRIIIYRFKEKTMKKAFILIIFLCIFGSFIYAEGAMEATQQVLDVTRQATDIYNNLSGNSSSSSSSSSQSRAATVYERQLVGFNMVVLATDEFNNYSSAYSGRIAQWTIDNTEYFRVYLRNGDDELYVFTPRGGSYYNVSLYGTSVSGTAKRYSMSYDNSILVWDMRVGNNGIPTHRGFINYK